MNAPFSQDARMGTLTTDLGPDALVLLRFEAEEHVNDLFTYSVSALSQAADIDLDTLVGTHATVELMSFDNPEVTFDGIITEAQFEGIGENGWRYKLILRPWLWLASHRRNQKIYHDKSVVAILDELFSPYSGMGQPAVKKSLSGAYDPIEYTVQYRESDLDFATRMMERFGISYHFDHAPGSHTLVLTDAVSAHDPLPGDDRKFLQTAPNHRGNEEHFWHMSPTRRLTVGGIRMMDYNFKTPTAAMEVNRMGDAPYANGQIESFDYPGVYLDESGGKDVARLRTNQERAGDQRQLAAGDCMSLRAGLTVDVVGDAVHGIEETSICLSARHSYSTNSFASGNGDSAPNYEGSYVLAPTSAPFAPERNTPAPVVQGPQTGVVVGDGEIDCDEFGRIKVRFPWDINGAVSMRCRVSQNAASGGWGGMIIPRIGMEVVVEFLEGDPDKPLVTGCVYNGKNDPPYPLPDNKTRSVFKTDTHRGTGFNELRIEDDSGKEEIFIHAQKDRNEKTLHNHTERVDNNFVQSVGSNKAMEIGNNFVEVIGGDTSLSIGPGFKKSAVGSTGDWEGIGSIGVGYGEAGQGAIGEGNYSIAIEKNRTETVGVDSALSVGQNRSESIGKDDDLTVGNNKSVSVGKDQSITVAKNQSESIGKDSSLSISDGYTVTVGKDHVDSAGKRRVIEAGDQIDIKCGKSMVTLKKDGSVTIKGKSMKVDMSDSFSVKASKIDMKASGAVTVKGSKVKMN